MTGVILIWMAGPGAYTAPELGCNATHSASPGPGCRWPSAKRGKKWKLEDGENVAVDGWTRLGDAGLALDAGRRHLEGLLGWPKHAQHSDPELKAA